MVKKIKCAICGTEFETNRPNKRYCSFTCKEAGLKIARLEWKDKNPHYHAEYMRERRKHEQDD